MHNARGVGGGGTNGLQRSHPGSNQKLQFMVNGFPLKHARVRSVGSGRQQDASVQQFLDVALHFIEACGRFLHVVFLGVTQVPRRFGA